MNTIRRRAYTLVELLAVTFIIVLLVSAAVPAFNAISKSSSATQADTFLRLGLASARNAAIASAGPMRAAGAVDAVGFSSIAGAGVLPELEGDTAAAVFYDRGGRVQIRMYREVGWLRGVDGVARPVFAPDPTADVFTLPRYFQVSGLAVPRMVDADTDGGAPYTWYADTRYDPAEANWVFPETDFYDRTVGDDGRKRQTFIVRFNAVTGELSTDDRQVLLWAPSPEISFRASGIWRERNFRPDRNPDQRKVVRNILLGLREGPVANFGPDRERLIGDISTDTVLARPVRQLALYDVRQLAPAVRRQGAPPGFQGVDRGTGCLYRSPTGNNPPEPLYDVAVQANRAMPEVADFYIIDRYSGLAVRLDREETP
ncbi:MAG: hypothetical protein KF866_03510 [Phycisphaeraceae bacterium]|nr:hypothetical protein [Phycisphaeraceae bacterium]MCW5753240.1 hypothetical protein [Phycisphaeraceae bacterium]